MAKGLDPNGGIERPMRSHISLLVLTLILATTIQVLGQSNYPERSIRLLYGFPLGNV